MVRAGSSVNPRTALILVGALALAGCQMATGEGPSGAPSASGTAAAAGTASAGQRVIERDIEAPDVFQIEEAGLWDGRPSLGGVWVAHPGVGDPERAMIRNAATGASVIGALFRRERENPGPRFQISSEAANALGILPGAPTEIAVTALRLQRVEIELEPVEEAGTAAEETLALAAVETGDAAADAAGAAVAPPMGAPQGQVEITSEEPERRGLFGLFRRRAAEPDTAIAETTLAPAAGAATVAAGGSAVVADAAASAATTTTAAEPPRERRGLRGLFSRRPAEPEATPAPDTTMIALPETAATPAPAPAPQPQGPRIDRPFVQIGIFSVEQNAINSRSQMQRAGLSAEIRRGRVGENLFWRVVVGPAGTTSERAAILQQVRGMGFADAYAVSR